MNGHHSTPFLRFLHIFWASVSKTFLLPLLLFLLPFFPGFLFVSVCGKTFHRSVKKSWRCISQREFHLPSGACLLLLEILGSLGSNNNFISGNSSPLAQGSTVRLARPHIFRSRLTLFGIKMFLLETVWVWVAIKKSPLLNWTTAIASKEQIASSFRNEKRLLKWMRRFSS